MSPRSDAFTQAVEEVAFAYERVPFFRPHLEQAGLTPSDIRTPEDFRKVPATSKNIYRKNFATGVLARGKTLAERHTLRSQSSGTAGDRLVTLAYTYDLARRMNATTSVHPQFKSLLLAAAGYRVCRYAAPNCSDVECATPHSTIADRTLADGTLVLPVRHDLLATPPAMIEQAIQEMLTYRPHWLYVDPTHMAMLCRQLRARGIPVPRCWAVLLTYTKCTQVARRQIREYFPAGVPIAEVLSMTELGWLTMECPMGHVHVNDETFYIELLDGATPVEPGQMGELVVTSLGDRLLPHIRYRTGDMYTLAEGRCPCRHPFPVVRHEGRRRDMLVDGPDILLTPAGLDDLIGPAPWLDVYKLHQLDTTLAKFWFAPNELFTPEAENDLIDRLTKVLRGARILVERSAYIPGEQSGKFLTCTSAVGSGWGRDD